MGAEAEKSGIPVVSIVVQEYEGFAKKAAQSKGLPSIATARIPFQVVSGAIKDVHPSCEVIVDDIIHGLTKWEPKENKGDGENDGGPLIFEGEDHQDAVVAGKWSELRGFRLDYSRAQSPDEASISIDSISRMDCQLRCRATRPG